MNTDVMDKKPPLAEAPPAAPHAARPAPPDAPPAAPTAARTAREAQGSAWAATLRHAAPIVLGYVPVGFAYGVLAQKNGLGVANTLLMSLLVYAGSAQLIAVGLFGAGVGALSVIATTFVVNIRHLLMSAALAPHLRGWSRPRMALFGYEITDETFAVHATRFARGDTAPGVSLGINAVCHTAWVASTALGIAFAGLVGDVRPIGLDFALPAMFIALLVAQMRHAAHVFVALFAGAASVALFVGGVTQWNVILATMAGATLGTVLEQWTKN
ncbi:MAG: AzlC family ABC transporter permease [Desulfovibrionaceae bacterium]